MQEKGEVYATGKRKRQLPKYGLLREPENGNQR